ncbi:MAG: alanine racemase [Candidatus Anammoxibacter sp.]
MKHRPTWVEIDLSAVSNNLNCIKNKVSDGTTIIAVVKANAYGHGIEKISKQLAQKKTDMFGVATVEDAVKLRENGIDNPILILGCVLPDQIDSVVTHSITPTIVNYHIAEKFSTYAQGVRKDSSEADKNIKVHVKVDTGMGGFGIRVEEAVGTIKKIKDLGNITIDGIFTHFTSPDGRDKGTVDEQLNLFNKVIAELESLNIHIPVKHTDNSSMVSQNPSSFNAIRPGIALYGLYSSRHVPKSIDLQQVMSFKTRVVNIKTLSKGDTISYNRTYKVKKESLIATLPVGYSDGYRRELSNKGNVLVRGTMAPVVGLIRMDFTYIDVTDIPGVNVGDEVVLFGNQGDETISIESIADNINAIPYEITCGIGKDVPRIYVNESI